MKKFLLMLISFCGVLTSCQRMPSKSVDYTPSDTTNPKNNYDTTSVRHPDSIPIIIDKPNPGENKVLYGPPPTRFEQKRFVNDTLQER